MQHLVRKVEQVGNEQKRIMSRLKADDEFQGVVKDVWKDIYDRLDSLDEYGTGLKDEANLAPALLVENAVSAIVIKS
jgi:hypothetical protein